MVRGAPSHADDQASATWLLLKEGVVKIITCISDSEHPIYREF